MGRAGPHPRPRIHWSRRHQGEDRAPGVQRATDRGTAAPPDRPERDPAATERILRALPDWFGIEDSVLEYVDAARRLPGFLARLGDDVVGVLLVARHFPESAEIHLMAVHPEHHREGIGRALVAAAVDHLAADGTCLLQVKTLAASHPSEHYPCLVMMRALG